ncbi:MAG: hypothetical protein LBB83_02220, partial [Treponema sp.]|nr:hypothetical protein [Treponema sp.]
MKKIWLLLVPLAIIGAGCSRGKGENPQNSQTQQAPQNRQLTLFTWEGMFPQEILDGFERDT